MILVKNTNFLKLYTLGAFLLGTIPTLSLAQTSTTEPETWDRYSGVVTCAQDKVPFYLTLLRSSKTELFSFARSDDPSFDSSSTAYIGEPFSKDDRLFLRERLFAYAAPDFKDKSIYQLIGVLVGNKGATIMAEEKLCLAVQEFFTLNYTTKKISEIETRQAPAPYNADEKFSSASDVGFTVLNNSSHTLRPTFSSRGGIYDDVGFLYLLNIGRSSQVTVGAVVDEDFNSGFNLNGNLLASPSGQMYGGGIGFVGNPSHPFESVLFGACIGGGSMSPLFNDAPESSGTRKLKQPRGFAVGVYADGSVPMGTRRENGLPRNSLVFNLNTFSITSVFKGFYSTLGSLTSSGGLQFYLTGNTYLALMARFEAMALSSQQKDSSGNSIPLESSSCVGFEAKVRVLIH